MTGRLHHHPLCHALIILLVGVAAYANIFGGPFVFDDLEAIPGNPVIRDLGNFLPGGSGYGYSRRWVGMLSFALNYRLGGLAVGGYHLVNLVIHLGTALLVYLLVRQLFRTPLLSTAPIASRAATAALAAAMLFVAHPVQTQAVTYIVQRLTSLCTFFYLLAIVLYLEARLSTWTRGAGRMAAKNWLFLTGATGAALLAMFTKEIAFTLPLAALLIDFSFFPGPCRQRLPALLPLLLTLPLVPILVFAGGEMSSSATILNARVDIPRWPYFFTQFPVIVTYLRLLILPVDQNLDYDFPLYTTPFTPQVLLSGLVLTGILFLAAWLYRMSRRQPPTPECLPIAFGLLWFFLTLAVESSLVPLSDVIFEHRLYLPSAGLAAAAGTLVAIGMQRTSTILGGRLPLFAAGAVILCLAAATWQRNRVWHDGVTLWQDTARKSPEKSRPWYNLGTYLKDSGRADEAIAPLERAVRIDPGNAEAWHNLGLAFLMTNRIGEALPPLQSAVRLNPEMDNATINYAVALILANRPADAAALLERHLQRFPDWAEARLNLGTAYARSGNLEAAGRELAVLRRLNPALAGRLAGEIRQAAGSGR